MSNLYAPNSANEFSFAQLQFGHLNPPPEQPWLQAAGGSGHAFSKGSADSDSLNGSRPPTPPREAGAHADDWDVLYRAVVERLKLTAVGPALTTTPESVVILQCLDAFTCLHAALQLERGRHRQLEKDVVEAKTSLSQLRIAQEFRAELVAEQAYGQPRTPLP